MTTPRKKFCKKCGIQVPQAMYRKWQLCEMCYHLVCMEVYWVWYHRECREKEKRRK